ncbi:MAG: NAD(P)H-dependent oxidoreductase [Saprospiraceae bacterium]|nr:NAD(P)H-dependent oxidoreductase [Saprospiraceae bacterium]
MNITIISGSPRRESTSFRVAKFLHNYLLNNNPELTVNFIDVSDHHLPYVQEVFTSTDAVPSEFKTLAETIFNTDAFLLVTPEYNGGYSPALKNLLDHFPKQQHKAFGIVTSTTGGLGGMRAAQQMLLLIGGLFGIASPHMLLVPQVDSKFNEDNMLIDEKFSKSIDLFLKEFLWLSNAIKN